LSILIQRRGKSEKKDKSTIGIGLSSRYRKFDLTYKNYNHLQTS